MKNEDLTKNLTKKAKTKPAKTTFSLMFGAVAVLTLITACKPKNEEVLPINAYTKSCIGRCESISGYPFFAAQTTAYKQRLYSYSPSAAMAISWSFSGQNLSNQAQQGAAQQGQAYQYSSPAMMYNGKVSAYGKVVINTPLDLGFCPQVPAGTYELSTQSIGQWTGGSQSFSAEVSGLRMLITGAAITMTATLSQGQASEYSYGYQYTTGNSRIYGNLIIEQVNGYYCQGAQFSLY